MTFKDRKLNSMTFQVFHDLYERSETEQNTAEPSDSTSLANI